MNYSNSKMVGGGVPSPAFSVLQNAVLRVFTNECLNSISAFFCDVLYIPLGEDDFKLHLVVGTLSFVYFNFLHQRVEESTVVDAFLNFGRRHRTS